jgi:hypothetical protein
MLESVSDLPRVLFKRWAALTLGAAGIAGFCAYFAGSGVSPEAALRVPVGVVLGSTLGYCRFSMNTRLLTRFAGGRYVDGAGSVDSAKGGTDSAEDTERAKGAGRAVITAASITASITGIAWIVIQGVFLAVCIKKSLPLFAGGAAGLLIVPVTLLVSRKLLRL